MHPFSGLKKYGRNRGVFEGAPACIIFAHLPFRPARTHVTLLRQVVVLQGVECVEDGETGGANYPSACAQNSACTRDRVRARRTVS